MTAHFNTYRIVLAQYPKDRVVRNELGRMLFLQHKYNEAIVQLQEAIAVDPEDLQANYNLMLCYKGSGDNDKASSTRSSICASRRTSLRRPSRAHIGGDHPEDNNERQAFTNTCRYR